jgi:hypothetical protein
MKALLIAAIFALSAVSANAATLVSKTSNEDLSLSVKTSGELVRLDVCNRAGTQCRQLGAKAEYSKAELEQALHHYKLIGFYPEIAAYAGDVIVFALAIKTNGKTAPLIALPTSVGLFSIADNMTYQSLGTLMAAVGSNNSKIVIDGSVGSLARNIRKGLPL